MSIKNYHNFIPSLYESLSVVDFKNQSLFIEDDKLKIRENSCLPSFLIKFFRYLGCFKRPEDEDINLIFYTVEDVFTLGVDNQSFEPAHKEGLKDFKRENFEVLKAQIEILRRKVVHIPGCNLANTQGLIPGMIKIFNRVHPG